MDILSIVNRTRSIQITDKEACYVIGEYIYEKKNRRVRPQLVGYAPAHEISRMVLMFEHAVIYFKNKWNYER